jgi:hypothetical protein
MVLQVFEEPQIERTSPLGASEPRVNWFLQSTRPQAAEGRRIINDLYSRMADSERKLRDKLRSTNDMVLHTALDELFIHDLRIGRYRVEYEAGEDEGTRPDFRLFEGSDYAGAVEIVSVFLSAEWAAQQRRNARLEDEISRRVPLTTHFVHIDIQRWAWGAQPRMSDIVRTLEHGIAHVSELPVGPHGYPVTVYKGKNAEIAFAFVRMKGNPRPGDRIVGSGPVVGGAINSAARFRDRLDGKDSKYDLRGKPYAIVLGVHDHMGGLDDVVEALVGTSAVIIATGAGIRKGDGFYGQVRRGTRDGKHKRVSCIFALEDWWPGGPYNPRVTRFDNPFAEAPFPDDAIPFEAHWGVIERTDDYLRADWLLWPQPPALV